MVDNARVMWESLRTRFSADNAPLVHELKAAIVACCQEGQNVATYFGKLKVMWDDLDDYEPALHCCCKKLEYPILVSHNKRRDHERIHQFLMGLGASRFGTTRTNLLGRLTLEKDLSLDQIDSELIAEERHLTISRSKEKRINVVSFDVQSGVNAITSITRGRNNLLCTHYGRKNHTFKTCFVKHEYPDGWFDSTNEAVSRGYKGRECGRGRGRSAPPRANHIQDAPTSE